MNPTATYGQQLRAARLQAGLSQREFALKAKVSKRLVEHWEHDQKLPPPTARTRSGLLSWAQNLPKPQTTTP